MVRKTRRPYRSQEVRLRGPTPVAERLRWLVDFAQQPSRPMTVHSARKLIERLGMSLREVILRREANGEIIDLRHSNLADLPFRGEDDQKSLAEKLALVRVTILTLLTQHLASDEQRPEARITLHLTANEDCAISRELETCDARDAAAYVMLLEIGEYGHRVRRCAAHKCDRIFVRQRRQRYCSVSCRNRATFRRWYRRQHRKIRREPKRNGAKHPRLLHTRRKVRNRRVVARA